MIPEGRKQDVLLPDPRDVLDPREVTQTAIVVGDHRALRPEAGAARDVLQESEEPRPAEAIHDERPSIGGHGEAQEVAGVLQVHPAGRETKHAVYVCR